ncbi:MULTISPECIES: nucleotide disphospho-sugar-binding domain-containing protein [unclassified Streptomyces]|uniref:nucleotide disphospho-sugar-binding domain-containing protein n=1 Tax=unclassified Streptomyces TaxID=2593676 RepID=UPI003825AB38
MRVLILSTPESTHFTTMVPLAWALRGAGHEVLVAGQPDIVPTARAAGLCTVTVGREFHARDLLSPPLPPGRRPIEVTGPTTPKMIAIGSKVWVLHARYMFPRYLEVARLFKPDLVVSEQMDYAALLVGGVLGIPVVSHRWGIDPLSPLMQETAADFLRGTCDRYGIEGGLPLPDVVLDPAPPELLYPGTPKATPIRHVPYNGTGPVPERLRGPGDKPRVVVSMGRQTIALGGLPMFRTMIEALGELPHIEAVFTVQDEYIEPLGPAPSNVWLTPPVPLNGFLGTCAAIVHHGGANTLMTATGAGVPQLVLPQLADQFAGGELLAATDAAISLGTADEQNDPATVADALSTLLDGERFVKGAAELARSVAAMPSPAAVVRDLENLRCAS